MINREISKCDCSQTSEPLASRRWLDFTAVFMYSFRLVLESFRTDRPRNASRNTGNIIRIKEFNHKLDFRLKCVLWFSFHDSQPSASPAQRAHSSNFPSQFVFAQTVRQIRTELNWSFLQSHSRNIRIRSKHPRSVFGLKMVRLCFRSGRDRHLGVFELRVSKFHPRISLGRSVSFRKRRN